MTSGPLRNSGAVTPGHLGNEVKLHINKFIWKMIHNENELYNVEIFKSSCAIRGLLADMVIQCRVDNVGNSCKPYLVDISFNGEV